MELTYEVFNAGGFPIHWSSWFPFGAQDKQGTAVAPRPAQSHKGPGQQRRTILVVDDHRDTLRSMKLLLTRLGYQVLAAENMTDALRIAQEEEFDILLSDIGLPDGSGLELIKRIRKTRNVPALALSGFGMDEDLQRSRDAGFSDHLTKPVSLDRLQSAIADLDAQTD
jgi:CheY-like chemotaxis protein